MSFFTIKSKAVNLHILYTSMGSQQLSLMKVTLKANFRAIRAVFWYRVLCIYSTVHKFLVSSMAEENNIKIIKKL